ncbi:TAXI family TRAP transporter solute-binding subunit [Methylobacterium durans]|uniref:C4-dicarboxylate ABC transporter substrate-binding protein n=1 Tax=Methylobacterium durans TaxID=2202825 RepID=A0A2U8W246_9HYPH|nr:TAXI family TRAP transporter solute-binding subunit [Methylobacterium durans]AWN40147.1 C4-dicarboxylate ABC transporter substrate-binding protein [Methylobacterium durans]
MSVVRVLAGLFALAGCVVASAYLGMPHADLRIAAGPSGTPMYRLIAALAAANAKVHPRVRLVLVETDSLEASGRDLEEGRVDLAVIRSDLAPPRNAQTIAILRRDVVAFVLPPRSPIDGIARLSGHIVALPAGAAPAEDGRILDRLLGYFDVPAAKVERIFLAADEIGRAVQERRAAAILAVGPIGPGMVVDAVGALARAEKGTPKLMAIDEAEAIGKRLPGYESIDVPAGAFRGRPEVPGESVTSVAVTYRLVASRTMLDILAAAIARSVFTMKPMLLAATPLASQIEAPDTDDKNPSLPIHPGVIAYLSNGDQSFFDTSESYVYVIGILVSLTGSALAILADRRRRRQSTRDRKLLLRLVEIAERARDADPTSLAALDQDLHGLVAAALTRQAEGHTGPDQWAVIAAATAHARHVIAGRQGATGKPAAAPDV